MSYQKAAKANASEATRDHGFCTATGCPNRWSCDMGHGRLCSWHDRSEPHLWPQVTQEQLDAQTERARANADERAAPRHWTRAAKLDLLAKLRRIATGREFKPHAWAHGLIASRENGEQLSPAQRDCLAAFEKRYPEAA